MKILPRENILGRWFWCNGWNEKQGLSLFAFTDLVHDKQIRQAAHLQPSDSWKILSPTEISRNPRNHMAIFGHIQLKSRVVYVQSEIYFTFLQVSFT